MARLAVTELGAAGLQSDARYSESFIRARFEKGYGPARIRQELRQRGLGDDGLDGYDWERTLRQIYARKYGTSQPNSPKEYAARVRFLSQRGFNRQQIQSLLRQIRQGDDKYFESTLNDNP